MKYFGGDVGCPLLISFNGKIYGKGALNINLFDEGRNLSYLTMILMKHLLSVDPAFNFIYFTQHLFHGFQVLHLNMSEIILITNQLLYKHTARCSNKLKLKCLDGKQPKSFELSCFKLLTHFLFSSVQLRCF